MLMLLRDFIRYHFQDNSIFVDNNSIDAEYETQTIGASGTYLRVGVKAGNGSITIDDECENSVANVIGTSFAATLNSRLQARHLFQSLDLLSL